MQTELAWLDDGGREIIPAISYPAAGMMRCALCARFQRRTLAAKLKLTPDEFAHLAAHPLYRVDAGL